MPATVAEAVVLARAGSADQIVEYLDEAVEGVLVLCLRGQRPQVCNAQAHLDHLGGVGQIGVAVDAVLAEDLGRVTVVDELADEPGKVLPGISCRAAVRGKFTSVITHTRNRITGRPFTHRPAHTKATGSCAHPMEGAAIPTARSGIRLHAGHKAPQKLLTPDGLIKNDRTFVAAALREWAGKPSPAPQRTLLGLLQKTVKAGDATSAQLAHLHDRCCVNPGQLPPRAPGQRPPPSALLRITNRPT